MAVCRSPSQTITPTRYHPSSALGTWFQFQIQFALHQAAFLFIYFHYLSVTAFAFFPSFIPFKLVLFCLVLLSSDQNVRAGGCYR